MCFFRMGHRAAHAQKEGSKDIEIRPSFTPHQTPQTSYPSSSSPPSSHHAMSYPVANPSKSNPSLCRELKNLESSSSSKSTTSIWSPATASSQTFPSPQSTDSSLLPFCSKSIDLGIDPTTLLNARTFKCHSLDQLRVYIEDLKNEFSSDHPPVSQYLLATEIPAEVFTAWEQEHDLFRGARATILHNEHKVLFKIMPGPHHECIIWDFSLWLVETLAAMRLTRGNDDFWLQGAAQVAGRFASKEPDTSFIPGSRLMPRAATQWPSLILEVGLSESRHQLRKDAQWWYANSGCQTRIVILIHADPNNADIEIWTEVKRDGVTTRGRPEKVLECTKHAKLSNGLVTGDTLELDFETLMRRPPQNQYEQNLVLTSNWIQEICQKTAE